MTKPSERDRKIAEEIIRHHVADLSEVIASFLSAMREEARIEERNFILKWAKNVGITDFDERVLKLVDAIRNQDKGEK